MSEPCGGVFAYGGRLSVLNAHAGDGRHSYAHVRAPIPHGYASARAALSDAAIRLSP